MTGMEALFDILRKIDGKPYSKFKDIQGSYSNDRYTLHVDSIQGSPFSEPSQVRVTISRKNAGFPEELMSTDVRRIALADAIARRFWESSRSNAKEISFQRPSQEILERGAVTIAANHMEAAFAISLPAAGKNAAGKAASNIIERLDAIVSESLDYTSYKRSKLQRHVETSENASYIRSALDRMGLVSFIANGSVLPRREDGLAPMIDARPFEYSGKDAVSMDLPNGEMLSGLGIRKGFTVVIGTTGSGRSVLADAVVAGVHDHIPGDGREYVVTVGNAVSVAKQERPANNVDHSAFLRQRPEGMLQGPIAESVAMADAAEAGSELIVMDEDSSSNAVMFRDAAVSELLSDEECVIPVTDIAASARDSGMSFILVSNSSAVTHCDDIILMSGGRASRVPAKGSDGTMGFTVPDMRYPLVVKERFEYREGTSGMPRDKVYSDSLKAAVNGLTGSMDGSLSIREISERVQTLNPRTARVRPVDIAMAVARSDGLSMIRRQE